MSAKKTKLKVEGVPYAYQLQIVVEDIQVPGGFTGYVRNIADQMRIQGCRGQLQRALSLQYSQTRLGSGLQIHPVSTCTRCLKLRTHFLHVLSSSERGRRRKCTHTP
jgi:hypothetical protein